MKVTKHKYNCKPCFKIIRWTGVFGNKNTTVVIFKTGFCFRKGENNG